jgi:alpha-amylase/alpha-mannosidase (GH57 family)
LDKRICIHGHFYQPPRENPFNGEIAVDPTASPYANWNQRITAECYAPNLRARILDGPGDRFIDNYEWISYDFGPTLLEWLSRHEGETYRAIVASDARSAEHFGGHGSAMAHAYNHLIMPLANTRDKVTQVRWGVADFVSRFGRSPEGMWLPETAVDIETLAALAAEGIAFTVLAPHQVAAVETEKGWIDVADQGGIDTRVPYRVDLPDGGSIAVFFYNGSLSQEIAFDGRLEDGRALAHALTRGLDGKGPALSHVATDGETFGHHHRFGEMALAAAIDEIGEGGSATLTNYAQFLADHPPTTAARVVDRSSWSCAHGVDRWRSDCGCSTGLNPGWDQGWRRPLRDAFDWLRDAVMPDFDTVGGNLFSDPWQARDDYVEVVLGGDPETFLNRHLVEGIDGDGRELALGLLEVQREAMLMYTSCGWFFDDVSGQESVLVMRHGGKVIDLMRRLLDRDLEPQFLALVDGAKSNREGLDGRRLYETEVAPYMESAAPSIGS